LNAGSHSIPWRILDAIQSADGGFREPLAIATVATADQIGALLTGYEESPSVTGSGVFTATIAGCRER
jgi:hypothetical protein